jgi:hypothetical protein
MATACATQVDTESSGAAADTALGDEPAYDDDLVDKTAAVGSYFEVPFSAPREGGFAAGLASSAHFCALSQVTHSYASNGFAHVFTDTDGTWQARGQGRAICTRKTNFENGAGNWQKFSSLDITAFMNVNNTFTPASCNRQNGNPNVAACNDAWWGNAATFINMVSGRLNGLGEYVSVRQDAGPNTSSRLFVGTNTSGGFLTGSVRSYFVGVPGSTRLVRLRGFNSTGGESHGFVTSTGKYAFAVGWDTGFSSQRMTRAELGFCGLVEVSGNFERNTRIEVTETLFQSARWWQISAQKGDGSTIRGSARCMAYDQR